MSGPRFGSKGESSLRRQIEAIQRKRMVREQVVDLADFRNLRKELQQPTILVVDDEPQIAEGIRQVLSPAPEQPASAVRSSRSLKVVPEGGAPAWEQVLALPGTHLHLYGKLSARPGRKMGHLNITGATPEAVRATALQAAALLGIEAF